jgi:hypothetical protein
MKAALPLNDMSTAEKLEAMELIWADLSQKVPEEIIPGWHKDVLAEREQRLASGTERVLDWEEAKRQLRREINENSGS